MTIPRITDEELIAFAADELTGADAERVQAYLARTPEAARTVAAYRLAATRTAGDDTVAPPEEVAARARAIFRPPPAHERPTWPERLEAIVARLVYDSRVEPATVRFVDTGRSFQLRFETDDAEIDLQIRPEGRWQLMGQLSADDAVGPVEIAAVAAGTRTSVARARSDERTLFSLELDAGVYDLHLALPDRVIVLTGLRLE